MINKIFPLIVMGVCVVFLGVYSFSNKKATQSTNKSSNKGGNGKEIAQYFINIMDIKNDILYGLDSYKRVFIEVEGICIDLLNKNDIKKLIKGLSAEISKLNIEFDLFCISQPFNIDNLKEQYEEQILNANTDIQRTLLRDGLSQILEFGENGDIAERKFYIVIQGLENEPEIIKRAELVIECFKANNIQCYRLHDNEIKRLINLFNNISSYNYDNLEDTNKSIPLIDENKEKEKTIDEKLKEKEKLEENEEKVDIEVEKKEGMGENSYEEAKG